MHVTTSCITIHVSVSFCFETIKQGSFEFFLSCMNIYHKLSQTGQSSEKKTRMHACITYTLLFVDVI